jgi:very-short-patch-repair endonuclease
MWSHLPVRNLIDMQRQATVQAMGVEIVRLYDEGYRVDADRLLDELGERLRGWREEKVA